MIQGQRRWLLIASCAPLAAAGSVALGEEQNLLAPQSVPALGDKRVLMARRVGAPRGEASAALEEATNAFRKFDFARSHQIARAVAGED